MLQNLCHTSHRSPRRCHKRFRPRWGKDRPCLGICRSSRTCLWGMSDTNRPPTHTWQTEQRLLSSHKRGQVCWTSMWKWGNQQQNTLIRCTLWHFHSVPNHTHIQLLQVSCLLGPPVSPCRLCAYGNGRCNTVRWRLRPLCIDHHANSRSCWRLVCAATKGARG